MSKLNNRDTLMHYLGQVWLTKPLPGREQGVTVCVETPGGFVAVGHLWQDAAGLYHSGGRPLGGLDSGALRRHIEKLAGAAGQSEAALFDAVCAAYRAQGSVGAVAGALGLSQLRVRRILITRGLLDSERIRQVAWLHDGGRGKTVAEIAAMLHISEDTVLKNLPYDT